MIFNIVLPRAVEAGERRGRRIVRKGHIEESSGADGLPLPRRLIAAVSLSLGIALTGLDANISTVALPTIARDLGIDSSASVLIVLAYQLAVVMPLLPLAALGDRLGQKRMFLSGQLLYVAAAALCLFPKSLPLLLVIRMMQGVAAAMMLGTMAPLVRYIYPSRHLGSGLAIGGSVVAVSAAISPVLGGLILSEASWSWLFAAGLPFVVASLALSRSLPAIPTVSGDFNWRGALLNMATFGLLVVGVQIGVQGGPLPVSVAITAIGLVVAIIFVRHESKSPRPVLPVDMLVRPAIGLSLIGAMLAFVSSIILLLSLPFRLEQVYGFSPGEVGALIMPFPAAMMVMTPVAGALSDRIKPGLLGGIGMAIAVTALLLLAFVPDDAGFFSFAWRMAMCGWGFAFYLAPNTRLIVGSTPPERSASVGATIPTARSVGQLIGAILMALMLSAGIGTTIAPALLAAMFAVGAGLTSIARLSGPQAHEIDVIDEFPT